MSLQDLNTFLQNPAFSEIDRHFARHVASLSAPASQWTGHAAALLSLSLQRGHVCFRLDQPLGPEEPEGVGMSPWPDLSAWRSDLAAGGRVALDNSAFLPMVLDSRGRLYLHRYWEYERDLAAAILKRLNRPSSVPSPVVVEALLDRYFPKIQDGGLDPARSAARSAMTSGFTVLTGAPGTGKTTAVLKMLALLLEVYPRLEIALAAPTGKAAQRMEESILEGLAKLPASQEVLLRIPRKATTLHRLLGPIEDSAFFRHDASHPLSVDVLVIDESSMVDLPLMAKTFSALKPETRVILIGDQDQLASVEAGSVLTDIIDAARGGCPGSDETRAGEVPDSCLANCTHTLYRTHRFSESSGIHRLCGIVRNGQGQQVLDFLMGSPADVRLEPLPSASEWTSRLRRSEVVDRYRKALATDLPPQLLEAMRGGRILCALRGGPHGMTAANESVESILRAEGRVGPKRHWYHHRPVVVTRNDYALGLFNGDMGIVLEDPLDLHLHAHFQAGQGKTRRILASRLPDHESAFAMTVHRSQGSEFDHVLVVLPDSQSPVLCRELLYTAVSRARQSVVIWASPETLLRTCSRGVRRSSGLADRLLEGGARRSENRL